LLPDADALIRSSEDPLLVLEYHRHFTHSLLFIPAGALIAAVFVWMFCRKHVRLRQLYLYALLGMAFAGLLDACTSYGTQLLWPFSGARISWNLIAIVDPVFTLLLLIPLVIAGRRKLAGPARLGLALAAAYLILAGIQHHRATVIADDLIAARGHAPVRHLVKPTLANIVLWRSIYIHDGTIHADAIRAGLLGGQHTWTGEQSPLLVPEQLSSIHPDSRAAQDLRRFARISDGWLTSSTARPGLIGDARYAMLPTSLEPLWGVLLEHNHMNQPLQFITNRGTTEEIRQEFMRMLWGESD
jgi:inner membrane protein